MNGASSERQQLVLGLVYVTLFFYVCLLRPAPEQRLSNAIAVEAKPAAVAALLRQEHSRPSASCSFASLPSQVVRWAAGERFSASSLLTASEQVDFSVEAQEDGSALLKGEMRWQVRGGLLGKVLDTALARGSREALLADCLSQLRAAAEQQASQRAAL